MNCPLCESQKIDKYWEKTDLNLGKREYFECADCLLVFLLPDNRLNPEEEKSRYDHHQNSPEDLGYVEFLKRLVNPLSDKLSPGAHGLDFGCGPGPTVESMMQDYGCLVENYDPFYFPAKALLEHKYDFITATEVVEHLFYPNKVFRSLDGMVNPKGLIGIMTEIFDPKADFADWWYHKDPTHVCFYRTETFEWIGQWLKWSPEFHDKTVVIYTKQ